MLSIREGEKMKSIVPYTKEIVFDSKIAEICSISLEHDLSCCDASIEGNFIVSGEYRSHEISINKESFEYKLPFSVDVTDKIVKESVDFAITDFTYEILKDSVLKVNIEFMVSAEEVPEVEVMEVEETIEEEDREEKEQEEAREAEIEEIHHLFLEEPLEKEEVVVEEEPRLDQESEELILDTASATDSEFVTYHIHVVSEEDTLESIVAMYQTDSDTLKNYNHVDTIAVGDKLLIPCCDE